MWYDTGVVTATPGKAEELVELFREATSRNRTILLGGNFSKHRYGGPVAPADVTISLSRMNQVLAYEPADLTISVGAGMTYGALTALLASKGQMLPLDPAYAEESSLGGVLACNLSGPRRRRFGTARDMVIGMTFVTLGGKVVKTGGMVVKNVAGLDMGKLMIGSLGTLAAIVSVNFKLLPLPEQSESYLFRYERVGDAIAKRTEILQGQLQPVAIDLLSPRAAWRCGVGEKHFVLAVQFASNERAIQRCRLSMEGAEALQEAAETQFWRQVREFPRQYAKDYPAAAVVRISAALGELHSGLAGAQGAFVSRSGNGVSYLYFPDFTSASQALTDLHAAGVKCVLESAAMDDKREALLWPAPGDDFGMMERVKQMFDPERLLNRGRMYGRI